MKMKYLGHFILSSSLLASMTNPALAASASGAYPVTIEFTSLEDGKQIVQSSYATLTDLNDSLQQLVAYTVHSISTGLFFDDQNFQTKKAKIASIMSKRKLSLHILGQDALRVTGHDEHENKDYEIFIPAIKYKDLSIYQTQINTIENARKAEIAVANTSIKLRELLRPHELNSNESNEVKQNEYNHRIQLQHAKSFSAIANALEQVNFEYQKELSQLGSYAEKAASGRYNEQEMIELNQLYESRAHALYWKMDTRGTKITPTKLFDGMKLSLKLSNTEQKSYYMPEITIASMGLENDSIYDYYSAVKAWQDLNGVMKWIKDWHIYGDTVFVRNYSPQFTEKPYLAHLERKGR